ncbi:uncharacterized protein LOC121857913 [Homarus americanus]|uniref:uncharacterized protein LOC121857913 n=1 Tax=Homarus americanus TaxID=6706 RepID=UPI001C46DA87|nr:uncharacterized protein LOC121857913 [Homarus americanus]
MMLSAYFDQYPAHLAAAARRQAGHQQPSRPSMAAPPPPGSDAGRTYTLTEASDDYLHDPHPTPPVSLNPTKELLQVVDGDEEHASVDTYSVPLAPNTPPAPSNGCPVHDPSHAHIPPHINAHAHQAWSSGGSSKSSAADSQLLHCGICTRRYSNPKVSSPHPSRY